MTPEPDGSMANLGLRLRLGLAEGASPRDLAMSREEILQAALALEFHEVLVRTVHAGGLGTLDQRTALLSAIERWPLA